MLSQYAADNPTLPVNLRFPSSEPGSQRTTLPEELIGQHATWKACARGLAGIRRSEASGWEIDPADYEGDVQSDGCVDLRPLR